ncbi:MAG: hypothetical protein M3Z46_00700 [Actinomycetota bacterium]|nr:hypothetical protein [Actinomycetota bacterium]
MAHPVETPARTQSGPLPDQWPTQATDAIVTVVGKVRDRTTGPALTVARGVVYGLFAAILGVVATVLAITLAIRLADNYIPGDIWIVYLVLGALFTIGGLLLWSKAFAAPAESD